MPLKRTYTIFFTTLISAILAILVFFFILRIIKHKNDHSLSVYSTIQAKLDQKDNISTLQKIVADTTEKGAQLSSYLVHPNNIDEFINFLESEGELVSIPIEVISVTAPKDRANHLTLEFKGTGAFDHVMRLVGLIENAPYQITINHTYINKLGERDQVPVDSKTPQTSKEFPSLFEVNISFDVVSKE
jgi:hypothetical protein